MNLISHAICAWSVVCRLLLRSPGCLRIRRAHQGFLHALAAWTAQDALRRAEALVDEKRLRDAIHAVCLRCVCAARISYLRPSLQLAATLASQRSCCFCLWASLVNPCCPACLLSHSPAIIRITKRPWRNLLTSLASPFTITGTLAGGMGFLKSTMPRRWYSLSSRLPFMLHSCLV